MSCLARFSGIAALLFLLIGGWGVAHAQLAPVETDLSGVAGGAVAWGDVDDDGDSDLLVLGNETGAVESIDDAEPSTILYENEGDGTFTPMNAGLTDVSAGAAAFCDFDQDGDLDLVLTGIAVELLGPAPKAEIYENDGTGTFTPLNAGIDGVTVGAVDWGDVDGDGDPDLLVSGNTGGVGQLPLPADPDPTTTIYENEGNGDFSPLGADLAGVSVGASAFGDMDNDGDPDLVVTGGQGASLENPDPISVLYENDGTGSFTEREEEPTDVAGGSVTWTDVDGDDALDLILTGATAAGAVTTELYRNDGSGSLSAAPDDLEDVAGGTVVANDIDADTDPDLLLSGRDSDDAPVTVAYENDGTGAFSPFGADLTPVEGSAAGWGDANRDGLADLVVAGRDADSVATATYYENRIDAVPIPSGLSAAAAAGPATDLTWTLTPASPVDRYRIYRDTTSFGNDPTDRTPLDSVGADTGTYTDESVATGRTYHYRVTAVGEAGRESPFSEGASAFLYPSTVAADATRSFGDASGPEDYRLVALPGQVDRPLSTTLAGASGTEWQAFVDDGSDEDFLVRHDGSDAFRFEPGTGFWLTARAAWTVEDTVSTVSLTGDSAAVVSLRDGWNIVSNPTDKPVPVDRVLGANRPAADEDLQPLWAFDGTFQEAETMRSAARGVAYYFLNDQGLDSLRVPYPGAPGRAAPPKSVDPGATGEDGAVLSLTARQTGDAPNPASTVRVGRVEGEDAARTVVAPPSRFDAVSLDVEAQGDRPRRQRFLKTALRPATGEGTAFPLQVSTRNEEAVQLHMGPSSRLNGRAAALVDSSTHTRHELRSGTTVTLRPSTSDARLTLLLGSPRYVDEQADRVLPDEVRLRAYPNPVRQRGTVAYTLPEASEVTLRLYDVLGRRVATLDAGSRRAGRHEVSFDPASLASGVYVGRLRAGDQTRVRKITVVR